MYPSELKLCCKDHQFEFLNLRYQCISIDLDRKSADITLCDIIDDKVLVFLFKRPSKF